MSEQLLRILLIDDNKHGLLVRRAILEELGYTVETALGGKEGIEKFDQQPFDLVVTDYRMPDVPGLQVLRTIRDRNKRVPVVILSGYVMRLGLTEESTGADAVVAKGPKEDQDLVRTVARFTKKPPLAQAAVAVAGKSHSVR